MTKALTVSCKLKVSKLQAAKLDATLDTFKCALNWVNQNTPQQITSAIKLQSLCYYEVRTRFGLSSNLTQQVLRRVAGSRKSSKQGKRLVNSFKSKFVSYDARVFSFREKDWTVSLTTVDGRERFELAIGNYQRGMLKGLRPKSAVLIKHQNGDYYIQICVKPTPPNTKERSSILGVDLGRIDIAYTSEGEHWDGQEIRKVRDHFAKLRANLQQKASKGTRSSRRRCRELLKRLSGRERRFQAWVNHNISKRIVQSAVSVNANIAVEDLAGIRERTNGLPRSKTERRRSNNWAFYQLRRFIEYKACLAGIRVFAIAPRFTSQTCHQCLHIHPKINKSYRSGKQFSCGSCGWHGDADFNAAKNIQLIGLSVNQPRGPWLSCEITGGLLKAVTQIGNGSLLI